MSATAPVPSVNSAPFMDTCWTHVVPALDILFTSAEIDITSPGCQLTVEQYAHCYNAVHDFLSGRGNDPDTHRHAALRLSNIIPDRDSNSFVNFHEVYSTLHNYITGVCQTILAEAPQSADITCVDYFVRAYKRYKWALHYTARLFAYAERWFIRSYRQNGLGWLQFDPKDVRFLDEDGEYDITKVHDMMKNELEDSWWLEDAHNPKEVEDAVLRAEVASDPTSTVSVIGLGLRQWRLVVNEPWLRNGGLIRLQALQDGISPPIPVSKEDQNLINEMFGTHRPNPLRSLITLHRTGVKWFGETYQKERSHVGLEALEAFTDVLYLSGNSETGDKIHRGGDLDAQLYMACSRDHASHVFQRFKAVVDYLEQDKGKEHSIQGLIERVTAKNSGCHLDARTALPKMLDILWWSLSFPDDARIPKHASHSIEGRVHKLFGFSPNSITRHTSRTFNISLTDLESAALEAKPTNFVHEHLLLEGNVIKLYSLNYINVEVLWNYHKNRVATALGIATLGNEVFLSLKALYASNELWQEAEALGIFEYNSDNGWEKALLKEGFRLFVQEGRPTVLADRNCKLQKLVKYRRSWWPSLVRDIRRQHREQPVILYGALLAVFFGICAFIQTVASVWTLVITIKAQ